MRYVCKITNTCHNVMIRKVIGLKMAVFMVQNCVIYTNNLGISDISNTVHAQYVVSEQQRCLATCCKHWRN